MSKLSVINRNLKRIKLINKFSSKRNALKSVLSDKSKNYEERYKARILIQKLPRNSNPTRQRNRCIITGRSRGVYSKFNLTRHKIREMALKGEIPGLIKASW